MAFSGIGHGFLRLLRGLGTFFLSGLCHGKMNDFVQHMADVPTCVLSAWMLHVNVPRRCAVKISRHQGSKYGKRHQAAALSSAPFIARLSAALAELCCGKRLRLQWGVIEANLILATLLIMAWGAGRWGVLWLVGASFCLGLRRKPGGDGPDTVSSY